jgi:hypothetical protein
MGGAIPLFIPLAWVWWTGATQICNVLYNGNSLVLLQYMCFVTGCIIVMCFVTGCIIVMLNHLHDKGDQMKFKIFVINVSASTVQEISKLQTATFAAKCL